MEIKNSEESNSFNELKNFGIERKTIDKHLKKFYFLLIIFTSMNALIFIINCFHKGTLNLYKTREIIYKNVLKNSGNTVSADLKMPILLSKEIKRIYLKEINKKRIFENRLPLPKEIDCKSHFTKNELVAFLSFLTKNTTFFETGSGCSSVFAKYFTKKSFAVEGCEKWYKVGIKKGLKENLIFHDLKPDNPIWSYPGKKSNINDWKEYFQSYDKKYNADVIFIDGRFKVATAMDIFDKIKDDTIVLIHEFQERPIYYIIENYYQYIYHWDRLTAFIKKKDVKFIPIEIQKKYWNILSAS